MKIIELIKSLRFFDFRKYISANLIVIFFCAFLICECIHFNTSYPPPIETFDWGEPHFEYCPEEQMLIYLSAAALVSAAFLCYALLIEFLLRLTIELTGKKFFPKIWNKQKPAPKFKVPKFIVITYSTAFYICFFAYLILAIIFSLILSY